jgi:endonuclease-3 related protein
VSAASPRSLDDRRGVRRLFDQLLAAHGPQHWWPGESPFEISVGAILVQRTAWHNAAAAIARLSQAGTLEPSAVAALETGRLQELIRPAGFFRQKSRTLQGFCSWLAAAGGFGVLRGRSTRRLRAELLALGGIGPETADSILLYALDRPVFVVDAYARRVFSRTGLRPDAERLSYGALGEWVETRLPADARVMNEYHALLVSHGKTWCRPRPVCDPCPVAQSCAYFAAG